MYFLGGFVFFVVSIRGGLQHVIMGRVKKKSFFVAQTACRLLHSVSPQRTSLKPLGNKLRLLGRTTSQGNFFYTKCHRSYSIRVLVYKSVAATTILVRTLAYIYIYIYIYNYIRIRCSATHLIYTNKLSSLLLSTRISRSCFAAVQWPR